MDLWIRSQNGEQLRKIVDLKYQYGTLQDANLKVIVGTTQYDEWDVLGSYETKERALEVLDDIENHIRVVGKIDTIDASIYQMPKE